MKHAAERRSSVCVPLLVVAAFIATLFPRGALATPSYISTLAIDPVSPHTLYTLTLKGVSKTTDAGSSWQGANSGLPLPVFGGGTLAIDPFTPSTLLLRMPTHEPSGSGPFSELFRSTDAGATWQGFDVLGLSPAVNTFRYVAVAPTVPPTIYVDVQPALDPFNPLFGLVKSADGGTTWSSTGLVSPGFLAPIVLTFAIDPTTPATLLAGILCAEACAPSSDFPLFKSTDSGTSWNPANSGLPAPVDVGTNQALAIDPSTPSVVYLGAGGGLFKSTDAGTSWNPASSGMPSSPSVVTLAVDPSSSSTVYAGAIGQGRQAKSGVFKSTDAGATWKRKKAGIVGTLVIDPSEPSTIYAALNTTRGTGKGVFRSTDGGDHWRSASKGLPRK